MSTTPTKPIVLFDGVCNLCAGAVRWVIPRDPEGIIAFASLQSPIGIRLAAQYGIDAGNLASVILIHNGRAYQESAAALRLLGLLPGQAQLLAGFTVVPAFIRDPIYRWVARNRYGWFGQSDSCLFALPGYTERFLVD